jgi:glutaconate CoA-transferase subunit B
VITDLCILEPDPASRELTVTSIHPGVTRTQIAEATGWPVRFAADAATTAPPSAEMLGVLRDLQARTRRAHGEAA